VFTGTPPAGSDGQIAVTVSASDGVATGQATFLITVASPNAPPQAFNDAGFQTVAGTPLIFDPADLLENDSDPNGDALVITSVGDAIGGSVVLDAQGRPVFTPGAGITGPASFTYAISDGRGGVASATVSITVTAPASVITGTLANDRLNGTAQDDIIDGLAGNDRLSGGGGNDTFLVNGDAGLDRYFGGDGIDTIQGGTGDDIIGVAGAIAALSEIEAIDGGGGYDVLRLTAGANVLDLTGISVSGIELIDGGAGADVIIATSGRDVIAGGAGGDTLIGGEGGDRFLVSAISGWDQFDGGGGFDLIEGSAGDDILQLAGGQASLVSIDSIDLGGGFDVIRTGNSDDFVDFSQILMTGVDRIELGSGNDVFVAGEIAETIAGGAGNDRFVFSNTWGNDVIENYQLGNALNRVVDVIDLSAANFADYGAVRAAMTQDGADTVISSLGGSIRIADRLMTQLLADDFIV
jgi:Ca2+-binding RTX toxin-like protein